jgi:alpha-D-xyloside xylohydrolase
VLRATGGGELELRRGDERLLTFALDAFQVGTVRALDPALSYDPYWLVVNDGAFTPVKPDGFRWRAPTAGAVTQDGAALTLALTYEGGLTATVTATLRDGQPVLRFVPGATTGSPVAYLRVRARADTTEAFFGLGEWFDTINHRGKLRPMQLEAALDVESGNTENHVVTPFLVGERGWGLFVESDRFGVFDVAKAEADVVDSMWGTAEASADGLTVHLFTADAPLDVLARYHRVTGFPRPPAAWALGPWLWRDESKDQAEVLDDVRRLRELDLATSGVWLDRPYATEVNTFDYDARKFPDAGAMVDAIAAAGLKLALWHTPYLAPGAEPLRSEALARGYFPPETGVLLNRWSAPLDFTNPDAVAFWRARLAAYTQRGVEGFKLDFAEDVVAGLSGRAAGWRFADGSTERTMHAGYTRRYHAAYRAQLANNDGFLLVRSGKWGTPAQGVVVWPGDLDATLTRFGERFIADGKEVAGVGGLPSAIRAGLGLSMSGFPFFAADTGGYRHSPPDKETWVRWVEQSALMPVMQTGDSSSQPPWAFTPANGRDAEALDVYRRYARLHLRLFPYVWSFVQQLQETGRPVVRPWAVAFPGAGAQADDVYTLGDALLVAPVSTRGATTRTFPRPPGAWTSWWTGAPLADGARGGDVTVDAPLGVLPLFLRAGALVPMLRPSIDTLAPAEEPGVDSFDGRPGALWVRVAPSPQGSRFTVYDGAVLTQSAADGVTLTATGGRVFSASVVWELVGVARPGGVTHAGAALPEAATAEALEQAERGWRLAGDVLHVKAPMDGAPTVVR